MCIRDRSEEGTEERKVVLTAMVPTEDPACLVYCIEEDEEASDCLTISSSDSDIEEIRKPEVKAISRAR